MRKSNKAASKPAASTPAANVSTKPAANAAAKPSKPAAANTRADRIAILQQHRTTAAAVYNGPSLTVHHSASPKLAACLSRIAAPTMRTDNATVRDESLLRVIGASNGNKPAAFDPVTLGCDLGGLSRLASLGFIATDGKTATLTATGAERAALVAKRA